MILLILQIIVKVCVVIMFNEANPHQTLLKIQTILDDASLDGNAAILHIKALINTEKNSPLSAEMIETRRRETLREMLKMMYKYICSE